MKKEQKIKLNRRRLLRTAYACASGFPLFAPAVAGWGKKRPSARRYVIAGDSTVKILGFKFVTDNKNIKVNIPLPGTTVVQKLNWSYPMRGGNYPAVAGLFWFLFSSMHFILFWLR
ncbi:MAG TPA: hypothetical protein DEU93_05270 [Chitinophagaceae bacterium]|nr:hypothetical protein [Chitinophagaceae bacterium]